MMPRRWLNSTVVGIGLASLFSDVGHEMATTAMPALLATLAVFFVSLAILVGIGFWLVPRVVNQFGDVGKQASQGFKDVQHWLTHAPFHLKQRDIDIDLADVMPLSSVVGYLGKLKRL